MRSASTSLLYLIFLISGPLSQIKGYNINLVRQCFVNNGDAIPLRLNVPVLPNYCLDLVQGFHKIIILSHSTTSPRPIITIGFPLAPNALHKLQDWSNNQKNPIQLATSRF